MNAKPHVMLLALAVLCIAAVAWAADAPRPLPVPPSNASQVAPGGDDDAALAANFGDDLELDALGLEAGPDGGGVAEDAGALAARSFMRGAAAYRGEGGMGGFRRGPGGLARLGEALDLSDDQRAKLADIHDRQQRRAIQAHADLQLARLDLRKAMRDERPDAGEINNQIDHLARLRADMAKARVASMLEARAVLSPEQLKQMRELRMHPPGAGRPGMGRGMGGNGRRMGGRDTGPDGQRPRGQMDGDHTQPDDGQ